MKKDARVRHLVGLRVDVFQRDLEELFPEWEALFAADPLATPFLSVGWARAWLRHWAGPAKPWVLAVRDHDASLVALAPLVLVQEGRLRVGRVLGKEPGDYWDVLSLPSAREQATRAIGGALVDAYREWDVVRLDALPPGSSTDRTLEGKGLRIHRHERVSYPAIRLPESFGEYLATLPTKRRTNLRRHLRALDEGEVELRDVREPGQVGDAVVRWHELHVRRWDEMGKTLNPLHRSEHFRDFMTDVAHALVPAGLQLVWELRKDGDVVGEFVNFVDDRSFYLYLGGFEPAFSRLGLGKIVIAHAIRTSIAAGRRYFDFTRGSEGYKYQEYGAKDREGHSLLIGNRRLRSRRVLLGTAARDRARTVRAALQGG